MELIITINMSNAAFGENQFDRGEEVERILDKYIKADRIRLDMPDLIHLFDSNGNKVGKAEVKRT